MENKKAIQFVDQEVTRIKFEKELQEFKQNEDDYRRKGIICIKADFPSIMLLFAIPQLKPQPIAFAVNIDFTNWDVEPPSVKFIDPFSEKALHREDIKINFFQVKDKNAIKTHPNGQLAELDLLQGQNEILPFFCIPGVKEYHQHPAHSGNSWMLHRTKGEGKLCVLIEQLYKHSIAQSAGFTVTINLNMGFNEIMITPDVNKLKQ